MSCEKLADAWSVAASVVNSDGVCRKYIAVTATVKSFDAKYLENGHRYAVRPPPREHLSVRLTGFRLAPSNLTLEDLEGSKIKVIKNGKDYDVGHMGFIWMTLRV